MVSDFFPPVRGGLEYHVDALAGSLADRGHVVAVATLTPNAVASHPDVSVFAIPALATKVLPHVDDSRPFHPPLPDPVALLALSRLVDAFRPDVVHGHSWLAVSLPRRQKAPVVFTAHDYGLVCQLRTLLKPGGVCCAGPSSACFACGVPRYGVAKSALLSVSTPVGRHLMTADRVIAVSSSVAAALRPYLGECVKVVPNFIPDHDSAAEVGGLPHKRYVMFAGDPSAHKGLQPLLALWRAADPPAAELLLCTTKPVEEPLPEGVRVMRLDRPQMHSAWRGAAVAVVPSLWADPFPTVALEAMAAGVPIVASRIGGLEEMFDDGVHGFHVEPGNVHDLRGRITELLNDERLRAGMGVAAKAHVERYRAHAVVPLVEDAYRDAIVRRGEPRPA
jgi:glycosyltransferase involved in cell wall biosynthesis